MGWAARLTANPERARYQQDKKLTLAKMRAPLNYAGMTPSGESDEQKLTSIGRHEAGHVCVAEALGFPVHFARIAIERRGQGASVHGYTEKILPGATPADDEAEKNLIQTEAGWCAEHMFATTDAAREAVIAHQAMLAEADVRADFGQATLLARGIALQRDPTLQGEALVAAGLSIRNDAADEAERLLRAQWAGVLAVGQYLVAHLNTKVSGDVLRDLLNTKTARDAIRVVRG